jgi:hypothetical protein
MIRLPGTDINSDCTTSFFTVVMQRITERVPEANRNNYDALMRSAHELDMERRGRNPVPCLQVCLPRPLMMTHL